MIFTINISDNTWVSLFIQFFCFLWWIVFAEWLPNEMGLDLSEILFIVNLWHGKSRISISAEWEVRLIELNCPLMITITSQCVFLFNEIHSQKHHRPVWLVIVALNIIPT